MAIYRELIHRYYFNNTNIPNNARPTLTDRMEGWDVYKELFDEIFESTNHDFYLVPTWVFEILFEFIYQFQGYCQIKSAVYATAKKNHLIDEYGNRIGSSPGTVDPSTPSDATNANNSNNAKHVNLLENLSILENNTDAWDVSVVFQYLFRFQQMAGLIPHPQKTSNTKIPVVTTYFGIFSAICQSRLECLLGDYTGCLLALDPLEDAQLSSSLSSITKDDETYTISDIVNSVVAARVSLAYHAGISYLQLRRYYDTYTILMNCTMLLQRGFKTGTIRSELFNKQYDRMMSLLVIVLQICPGITKHSITAVDGTSQQYDESMIRSLREKHSASKIETIKAPNANRNTSSNTNSGNNNTGSSNSSNAPTSYDEWFASPKFITSHPMMIGGTLFHKQQFDLFHHANMKFFIAHGTTLRSFLKLYTSIPLDKLASFHDIPLVKDFLPILLTYKARLQYQIQRVRITASSSDNTSASASLYSSGIRSGGGGGGGSSNDSIIMNAIQDDMHYYIQNDTVFINEAEEQRHLESYLCAQMRQLQTIHQTIAQLDTKV